MEGACAHVEEEEEEKIVRKVLKRKYKGMKVGDQFKLQSLGNKICIDCKFKVLFVPTPYKCDKNSYTMDKIDDSYSYESKESGNDKTLISELKTFYKEMMKAGYFPLDYELFKQKDDRVALIDFDKFMIITKDFVVKDYLLKGVYVPEGFTL